MHDMKSISDLANYVNAFGLAPGQSITVSVIFYDTLKFDNANYQMPYQELDARLGPGFETSTDVTPGSHRVVITRRAAA
ncbi:MAG: hypothetical protein JSS00_00075 [Proteobacteria bacterium]|nr:hypothetical protein [Pseudomonadota bacterium]